MNSLTEPMRSSIIISFLILILSSCSIERVEEPMYTDTDTDTEYYHAFMRKHGNQLPGCDLFFELDDGTVIVPYMLNNPLMMPDGQEVEISFNVLENIDAGCAGGVAAQITGLRQVGCGPIVNLGMDWAINVMPADDFDIDEDEAELAGDCLKLVVSYKGGCEIHEFILYLEPLPAFDEIQGMLSLAHYAHGDSCDVILRDTVAFDLAPLQRRSVDHLRFSLTKADHAEGAVGGVIYIDYYY
jgi:hypothetical protein